ncbi:pyridoxal phosphate-dependent transferase [Mycena albidolilacea]|uniref:Kynureninase n=1 Tax=Mycena albidolilacea TaxID=1033008 RepID=A0AAD6ZXP5_9AGAR|nr:pyridoxal phosphate-dependent transferase [Mycena albidolilacea]
MSSALSDEFVLPTNKEIGATSHPEPDPDSVCTYLCGNSLGPLSKRSKALVEEELKVWGTCAVTGHFSHPHGRNWVDFCDHITPLLAELVGAKEKEVACMGTLTANLHLMMDSFYKPTPERYKILCEAHAFPSDQYAFASQALAHGLDPAKAVLEMSPRPGEYTLREEDILDTIAREGSSIALVLFSGVQYYTGQWFPMQSITRAAQAQGSICGWDLAHAVGNVPLALHDWGADFAVWCTYKYVNAGPGSIAGLYVHEKWKESELPKFAGWWGHDPATRFAMPPKFSPIEGAQGFQQSNPGILVAASLLGSLQIFKEAGMMKPLRERSLQLTGALENLLTKSKYFVPPEEASARQSTKPAFTIITPADPDSRGAQLSLLFLPSGVMQKVHNALNSLGVISDERNPDIIRLAPAPLFNTLKDCEQGAIMLERVLDNLV